MFFSRFFKWLFFWVVAPALFGPSIGRFKRMQLAERKPTEKKPWKSFHSFAAFWYLFHEMPKTEKEKRDAILEASLIFLSKEMPRASRATLEDCFFVIANTESLPIRQQAFQHALCYVETSEQFEELFKVAYIYFGEKSSEAEIVERMNKKPVS
jgi:hypothetical protein